MPLTQEDRRTGASNSLDKRRKQQAERRKEVKRLFDTGMPKAEIARQLGVSYKTVFSDLKCVEE